VEPDPDLVERAARHAALGDPVRLAIVDQLALSDRTPSELRRHLAVESNLLAHHLGVLERAGLLERTPSDGDRRRRYLRLGEAGRHLLPEHRGLQARSVLFVCTRNSARSQLAAALWNRSHGDVPAASAGTAPSPAVHPRAVEAAATFGLDLHGAVPRSVDELAAPPDLVVTVCDRAHEELAGWGRRELHWSTRDPAADGRRRAFETALRNLAERVARVAPLVTRP
jgi:protein-tyrosine-phosphatase